MPANSGAPASAGTRDIRVLRLTDQTAPLAEVASVENPTANPPTVNALDTATATGGTTAGQQAQIDTTETARLTPSQLVARGKPAVW